MLEFRFPSLRNLCPSSILGGRTIPDNSADPDFCEIRCDIIGFQQAHRTDALISPILRRTGIGYSVQVYWYRTNQGYWDIPAIKSD
jgi:hypothetical protein